MDIELDELYQELILDHFKNPRCSGCLANPDASSHLLNPLCGDQIDMTVQIKGDELVNIGFAGCGCSISRASASLMSELCKGKSLEEVKKFSALFQEMLKGYKKGEDLETLGDVQVLAGVSNFPARIRCAMLAWEALEKCIKKASEAAEAKS